MKMKNLVQLSKPLTQEIEATVSYDATFKTNFLTLYVSEDSPTNRNPKNGRKICEETTICLNNKEDAQKLLKMLQEVLKKVK